MGNLDDNLRALEIEAEAYFGQSGLAHGMTQTHLVLGVEHKEAAAAGAGRAARADP